MVNVKVALDCMWQHLVALLAFTHRRDIWHASMQWIIATNHLLRELMKKIVHKLVLAGTNLIQARVKISFSFLARIDWGDILFSWSVNQFILSWSCLSNVWFWWKNKHLDKIDMKWKDEEVELLMKRWTSERSTTEEHMDNGHQMNLWVNDKIR